MFGAARVDAGPLLGRDAEAELVTSLVTGIHRSGGTLVLRGEPGIGKSRLLEEGARLARERDVVVLSATGVQSEAHLAFSGLHQLLRPVRARAADLPANHRAALDAAFGLSDDAAPEPFRIAMAVLDLLTEVASDAPVMAIVDDAHWLDRPSADALAFVARRVESDPIVLLVATRDGHRSALADAGLQELRLGALGRDVAGQLLDASGHHLTLALRSRLLKEAAGNPLALIELPVAVHSELGTPMTGVLPLTERLERAFAARVLDLPEETRLLLLVAALNDEEDVDEVLHAGSAVARGALDLDHLQPAADADVVDLDVRAIRFRHPLIRSAVRQGASVQQRRRVHEALADTLSSEPERRVWHRAALITGVHEDIAAELDHAGRRARRRGAIDVAATALRRAAELSEPAQRGRRLLGAAELAYELGRPDVVAPLLQEVEQLGSGPLDRARATWIEAMTDPRPLDSTRAAALIAAADRAGEAGDRDLHVDLLWLVALRAWWADPGPAVRQRLVEGARRLGNADSNDPRVFAIYAYADPVGHAPEVLARLRAEVDEGGRDIEAARHLGPAALVVGAFDIGMTFLAAAVEGLRAEGRVGHLTRMLVLQGQVAAQLADWDVAIPAAEEARRLATELGEPMWIAGAQAVVSMIAGTRGEAEQAQRLSTEAEQIGLSAHANVLIALAQFGRVLAALGAGRHADAYQSAERLFDRADPAHHPVIACWLIGDLAEAALHAGRVQAARARVAQVEAAAGDEPAIWIELGLRHARALLADTEQEATERFEEALAADLRRWPFQRGRILLAQGQWLRRRRRIAESRAPLRMARDVFDSLGCASWSDQARRELRASGESSRRRDPHVRDRLTAQELQIAQLAADGLSNREIGQRLYLSHRTVGTHLYRAFPKLGITTRNELSSVLSAASASPGS
jgi:DNA-binding CsgD family transcriptional regulator